MADNTQDVGLTAVVVDGIAQCFAIDGQRLIVGVLQIPAFCKAPLSASGSVRISTSRKTVRLSTW